MAMDWKLAIKINKEALVGIVAGLVAWLAAFEGAVCLPRGVYQSLGLSLHKAESALRRLIVIAARGLVVPLPLKRPMSAGFLITSDNPNGPTRRSFPLFDPRVDDSFAETDVWPNPGAHVHYIDDASLHAKFPNLLGPLAVAPIAEAPTFSSAAETKLLHLRLAAAQRALQNLGREAKRLARWQARRKAMENPKFTSPIRPGPPPGNNKGSNSEIDLILRECHGLAFNVLKVDSS